MQDIQDSAKDKQSIIPLTQSDRPTKEDQYKRAIVADAMLMYEFNLSQNRIVGEPVQQIEDRIVNLKKALGLQDDCKYMDFIEAVCWDMPQEEKDKFIEKMNVYCLIDSFIAEKYEIQFDTKRSGYGGEFFWTQNTVLLTKDEESGDIMGLTVVKNITDSYRQKEEKLYQLEVINALTLDYSNVYMVNLITCQIRSVRINDISGAFYSDTLEGMFYDDVLDFYIGLSVFDDDRDMMRMAFSQNNILTQLATRESFYVNYRTFINGKISYMKLTIVRIGDIQETKNFLMGFMNVDEETEHEMKMRRDLQTALSEAKSANSAKSRFLSNMSHDIRTPMNAIIGFTSLAETHTENPEKVKSDLAKIKSSSTYLLSLINDVLDMSRIESGKIEIKRDPTTIDEILSEVDTIIQSQLEEKKLDYSVVRFGDMSKKILCDKLRLKQILINIVGNSVKYTPDGGEIRFTVAETPPVADGCSSYQFRVKDTGIGMSDSFQKHVFEPFERDENVENFHIQGTGLGLSISKKLVEKMDGSIFVKSKKGVGTEFLVCLDFDNISDSNLPEKKEEDKVTVDLSLFKGVRILLVEDNELNREIATELLKNAGFILEEAVNGKIAVEMIENASEGYYDMVLMDVMMPIMNGYEASMNIRKLGGEKSKIPIVAMTANAFEEDKKKALECGMSYFVSKPFDIGKLLKILSEIISKNKKD